MLAAQISSLLRTENGLTTDICVVKYTGRGLVVKRPGVLSKVQVLNLVLGVGVFSLLSTSKSATSGICVTKFRKIKSTPDPDTPPICVAMLLQNYALFLAESSIYTANLCHDAAPMCIAMLLQKY